MKTNDKEQVRRDISEAFDFVRFIFSNPTLLKQVKDGCEIRFLPAASAAASRSPRMSRKVQAFTTETVFHAL